MKHAAWLVLLLLSWPMPALAWEPFRSESSDVARGNELLKKGQAAGALEAYETAARKLPNNPGVQLNRGLALMAQGKVAPAREAFRSATQGDAPAEVRGDALYNMGLAFMNEADQAQKGDDLDAAQKLLRESLDAFKGSLRAKPGNRDAAWNLELAKRRLVEVEKKQAEKKQEEEQKKKDDENKQDEQENQDDNKDSDEQGDAGTPEQPENQGDQREPKQDQGDQNEAEQKPQDGAGEQKQDDAQKDGQEAQQKPDSGKREDEAQKQPKPSEAQQDAAEAAPEQRMPEHMRKALDALSAGEENLEKHRAQMRARQRPRRIEKDW